MDRIVIKKPAKINLGLDIKGIRDNGYHDVKMVMQTVSICDELVLRKLDEDTVIMKTNVCFVPTDDRNLVVRAIKMLKEEFNIKSGVRADLKKVIPVSAGMAGGSTDAAGALQAMNELFALGLSKEELKERGVKLGADIPFCIEGNTALSEGIGEVLTALPKPPHAKLLVIKPKCSVSTKWVYEEYDRLVKEKGFDNLYHPDIDKIVDALKNNDLSALCTQMGNTLEEVTIKRHPIIKELKDKMTKLGAIKALMSGSGPTVFGVFNEDADLNKAKEYFKDFKGIDEPFICEFFNEEEE